MGNSSLAGRKAQSFLESSFMLVGAIFLVLGIVRIGLWYNSNIAQRQPEYNATRLESAGEDSGGIGQWPVYERSNLTEDWVLKGENFGDRKAVQKSGGDFDNRSDYDYDDSQITQALDDINASQEAYKNASELDYEAYTLDNEADELDEEAEQLDAEAVELDAKAQEQEQLYYSCLGAEMGGDCQAYWDQAVAYRTEAQEKRDDAAVNRAQASENRSQANKDRNKADNKREKGKEKKNDSGESKNDAEDEWEDNFADVFDDEDQDTRDKKEDELTDDGTLDKLRDESAGSNKKK